VWPMPHFTDPFVGLVFFDFFPSRPPILPTERTDCRCLFIDDRDTGRNRSRGNSRPLQSIYQNTGHLSGTDVTHDSAHVYLLLLSPQGQLLHALLRHSRVRQLPGQSASGSCLAFNSPIFQTELLPPESRPRSADCSSSVSRGEQHSLGFRPQIRLCKSSAYCLVVQNASVQLIPRAKYDWSARQ